MKLFWNINDLELIYLIKEQNETAYNLMYKKYLVLIGKTVSQLGLKTDQREEFIQEGLLQLEIAIHTYNEKYGKSFYSFFDFVLKRRLYRLLAKNKSYTEKIINLEDDSKLSNTLSEEKQLYIASKDIKFKNDTDKLIYEEVILSNRSIKSLCEQYSLTSKKVYNRVFYFKKQYKAE